MARRRQRPNPIASVSTGSAYLPALNVRSFGSEGNHTRILGWKTKRTHELASNLELMCFFVFDWSPLVHDIREQYPLSLDSTLQIAAELGIKHPAFHGKPTQMTTDFVLTMRDGTSQVRSVKAISSLQNPQKSGRLLEKLELERQYWIRQNPPVNWRLVTENEIPKILAKNVQLIHGAFWHDRLAPLSEEQIAKISSQLTELVLSRQDPLVDLCAITDERLKLASPDSTGSYSLKVAQHLIARKVWGVNMNQPLRWSNPLTLTSYKGALL